MTYARYGLHLYVVPDKKDVAPYKDLVRAGQRLHGLMRTLLFKRLESSVVAFRETVTRLIERHKIFLNGVDDGVIIAGEKVEDLLKGIEEGDAENADLRALLEKLAEKYNPNEDVMEASVDLEVQEAEDLMRRVKRQQPELFARITSLSNAVRTAKQFVAADTTPPKRPAVFFFGQAGDFQRLWLADVAGNIIAEDNHSSLIAIACSPDEKRRKLPPDYNALVTKLKTKFDQQYQEYLAAGGTPHRLTVSQRWALDTIRDAYKQAPDLFTAPADLKAAQERLERLRKLWSVSPIDARVEFALRGLRNQKPAQEEAINRLESIAFEYKLDVLAERQVELSKLATEPVIICTEALV